MSKRKKGAGKITQSGNLPRPGQKGPATIILTQPRRFGIDIADYMLAVRAFENVDYSRRYDCDKIFTATGDKRNQLVLMMAIDIAVYHIFCIHNPRNLSPLRKERHERAVEWLKAVAAEEISVDGLPLLSEETRAAKSNFLIKSNRKRVNHW